MSDQLPVAVVRTRDARLRRISLIWAIPLVSALVAAWLAWDTLSNRGPLITIRFDSAASLQPNQSRIRHRDVDLGVVQKIALSPDRRYVIVSARMSREAEPLLTSNASFWVVKPRFFAGSVSGLETLVSGAYIQLEPIAEGGEPATAFIGLEDPPVLRSAIPGHTFRLKSRRVGSLNPGSPILFRDLTVGEILGWDIGEMAKDVTIHAFVRAPFDRYVHDNTVFWNAAGASVQLGANGLRLELESVRALILGGVAFETPDKDADSAAAPEGQEFVLYTTRDAAETATYGRSVRFISFFRGSVAGLTVGAPVTLHGLRIGAVTDVALRYDRGADAVIAVVRYDVEPDRIARLNLPVGGDLDKMMLDLVGRGLRIRLESASLVTGSKQLVMEISPTAPKAAYEKQGDTYVIPPLDGDQGDIASSASALIARLHTIPFEQIGENLNQTLAGANGTINDPKLREAIASLSEAVGAAQALMTALNKGIDPVMQRLPRVAAGLEEAIKQISQLTASVQSSYGNGSQFNRETSRLLSQVNDAARSVRILAELLARHPEALIRGRTDQEVR